MAQLSIQPNDKVTFKIRFEDEHVMVVEKPPHMVTQPGLGHVDDSLLNGLYALHGTKLQKLGKVRDFGLLHRLDRETSGLLLVALRGTAYDELRRQFEEREIRKYYWAVVEGELKKPSGLVNKPILEASGKPERALQVYRAALKINPHLAGATEAVDRLETGAKGQEL